MVSGTNGLTDNRVLEVYHQYHWQVEEMAQ
jgi:hypothetical protein